LEELDKKNITSNLLQNGSDERCLLEELEKKMTSLLPQNRSGESTGRRSWRRRTSPVFFFKMEQVRGMGWRSWRRRTITSLLLQNGVGERPGVGGAGKEERHQSSSSKWSR
jgi:hypothetical protein